MSRRTETTEKVYYYLGDGEGWTLDTEIRKAVVDRLRGDKPTTVLGVLMGQSEASDVAGRREAIAMEELAELAGRTVTDTESIVEFLEADDLAARLTDGTVEKVSGFAYYTGKNAGTVPSSNELIAR